MLDSWLINMESISLSFIYYVCHINLIYRTRIYDIENARLTYKGQPYILIF